MIVMPSLRGSFNKFLIYQLSNNNFGNGAITLIDLQMYVCKSYPSGLCLLSSS